MEKKKSISQVSIDKVTFKRLKNKEYRLKSRYNLDIKTYNEMLKSNEHRCYICNKADRLVVDHDHSDGKVRGLLCHNCNIMLGHAKDNCDTLSKAIQYLKTCKQKSYEIVTTKHYEVSY
jgi:hypothetical protein